MGDLYKVSSSDRVLTLEKELVKDLNELKNEIDDNERVYGITPKPVSTVLMPKDVSHFRRERKLVLDRAMQVTEAHPITVQADIMVEEMSSCEKREYTPESLPLLLHQFFLDRMHQLVQSKHMHMLRWKRFCDNTNVVENMYNHYQDRLNTINAEYEDCLSRAQRLSAAREAYLSESDQGQAAVTVDDMIVFLRALVCHHHAQKRPMQFIRILEWFPVIHKLDVSCSLPESSSQTPGAEERSSSSARQSSRQAPTVNERAKPTLVSGSRKPGDLIPAPPPVSMGQFTSVTTPHPASLHYAAAAAGGGLAADEQSQTLPLNYTDLDSLRTHLDFMVHMYGVQGDVNAIRGSADELELFAAVNRKFKSIFMRQQVLNTFHTYDKLEAGMETWGADHSSHALKREANWLKFVKLKPEKDPYHERHMTLLRQSDNVDKLLQACARFIHTKDAERVQDTLRDHASLVRRPPTVQAASVTSHRTANHTMQLWKHIYSNPELFRDHGPGTANYPEFEEKDADQVNLAGKVRAGSARKRRESYDYSTTVQMLGLDDSDQGQSDPASSMQGAYLSYLHLRFLRIRDQQRTCLSIMNYFRSIERTLTINEAGLSQESGKMKSTSIQQMKRTMNDSGPGCVLGSHQYLHNTPADYKVSETEFMQFSDLENHDDFYSLDEGRVHVQDQRGYYIMYDAAQRDFDKLENDLLLLSTHYIEKDKDLRTQTRVSRSASSSRRSQSQAGDFEIAQYAHQEVDRYGILMDMWTCEAAFLEAKKNLLDCYYEAYQHVFDPHERRSIAQIITNILHLRPRYDMSAQYFLKVYRMECINIRLQTQIVKRIMENQIIEEREYINLVTRDTGRSEYGLPYPVIRKQPISINMSSHDDDTAARPALRNVFLLEFHPSLSTASRVDGALKYAYWQLYHVHKPETMTEAIHLEKEMLELALDEFDAMDDIGKSFAQQVQKDVFGETYIEEPKYVVNLALELLETAGEELKRKTQKEKHVEEVKIVAQVLEMVDIRSRLLDVAWQSEILSKVYRKHSLQLGFDEYHLFLRFVQFEFAAHKDNAGKPPPVFITALQEDDSYGIDKFIPSVLYLAINELDESNVGKFSFRTKEGIVKFASGSGLQTLQTVLQTQIVHKNALVAAVQLSASAQKVKPSIMDIKASEHKGSSGRQSPSDTKSEKSSLTATTAYSSATGAGGYGARLRTGGPALTQAEAFVSLQMEKGPSRDLMLNEFIKKKKEKGMILKNPIEMENLKRTLITEYNHRLNNRMYQYSLRGQLTAQYESMLSVMEQFPDIRDNYFMLGEANEKKAATDSEQGLIPNPTSLKRRPRRLLSSDGRKVLNIWFIPHFTELLVMYKHFEDLDCNRALKYCVQIVSALHDILHYLCAHAQLGSAKARLGSNQPETVSADWGGSEGIGVELHEIQKQIDHLMDPCSPQQVAEFLRLRRDVMFLEFETSVRHSMCQTFLAMGNADAYQTTADNMHHALPQLSSRRHPGHLSYLMTIPDPLVPWDFRAKDLYPWRSFAGSHGMFPVAFWPWQMIEYYMRLCLAGLKDVEQHTAQGEILGVSLLMEDVIGNDAANQAAAVDGPPRPLLTSQRRDVSDDEDDSRAPSVASSRASRSSIVAAMSEGLYKLIMRRKPISRTYEAVEAYKLIKSFLLLWKRLEFFKQGWGCRRLDVESLNTVTAFKEYTYLYKTEKYFPVIRSIASRHGHPDFYDGIASDAEHLPIAPDVSEMEIRAEQLVKLCESFECNMILEIKKKINKELNLVLSERAREESALPTDLWKKPAIKESYTINRPHHYENFHTSLMSDAKETEQGFLIPKTHLNDCLQKLSADIMRRERHNYESYSMFYENLLRVNHQLLYQKEQEIKQVRDQLQTSQRDTMIDVQARLADQSNDLLMEVTALRAKVAEMREISLTQERDVRMKVKEEYDGLIRSLFSSSFDLKARFDEFRMELHADICERISEARTLALDRMNKIKQKTGGSQTEDALTHKHKELNDRIKQMKQENLILNRLLTKMKSFTAWKQKNTEEYYLKQIAELRMEAETCKKDYLEVKMLAEEEVILLRQQLFALRRYLEDMEQDSNVVKKQLDKEVKARKEKLHAAQQKAQSQKQLEMAKQANAERLLEELEEKDIRLRVMEEDREKQTRLAVITEEKARKDVDLARKRLAHERGLKLDAFQRVDELQQQVYDTTLATAMTPVPAKTRPKTTSSVQRKAITPAPSVNRSSSGIWPPPVQWPANRSPTPLHTARSAEGKIQRPKTVDGRLRSRVADQLISNIDARNQMVQLQAIQL